ncbi:MAG: hypothetical protein J6L69_10285 [Lachnospiraceae bacterium]|nr:hypothetical protein [Lachnospiraceae bacterium]
MEGLTLEKLQVIIDANTKGIRDELSKVNTAVKQTAGTTEKQTGKIKSLVSKIGKGIAVAFSVAAIASFSKSCIELGSDLQEVQNVVDVTFESMSGNVNEFAKSAISQFGLSELSAKQYTSTMGAMLKSMGITSDEVLVMSKNLTGLAGDMASFYNLSGDDAFAKLRAGISGETEPLKQLGINMSVANLEAYALSQGITKAYNDMEQAEQVLLRYNYLMEVTSDAQGDFARTSNSWANQTKILSESFNSVKASVGQGLINVLTPVLRLINEIIPKLQTVADMFRDFSTSLFGDAGGGNDAINDVAASSDVLSSNMESTATSAESVKRALSGIDKLNNISSGSKGEDSGTSSSMALSIDTSGITNTTSVVNEEVTKIKSSLNKFTNWIKNNFSGSFLKVYNAGKDSIKKLSSVADKTWKTLTKLKSPLMAWFNVDVTKYLKTVVDVSANYLADMLSLYTTVFSDIWTQAGLPLFEKFVVVGLPMFTQVLTEMTATIGVWNDEVIGIVSVLWTEGIVPILNQVTTVWSDVLDIMNDTWQKYGATIFEGFREAIRTTADVILNAWETWIKPTWDSFMKLIDKVWSEHMKPLLSNLANFVGEFVDAALAIYNKFIAPIVGWLSSTLGPIFKSVFQGIFNVVEPIIGNMIDAINGIITTCTGIVTFIKGVFTGDWKTAWTGVKTALSGIWNGMVSVLKIPINLIIGMINAMITGVESALNFVVDGINKLSFDIPEWVPKIGGKTFGFDIDPVSFSKIEYLAKGGIVNSATPAIIGEAGKEAVLPLENNTGWMDILFKKFASYSNNDRLSEAIYYLADKIGDGNIYVKVDMDGDVVYEKVELRRLQNQKMTAGYAY